VSLAGIWAAKRFAPNTAGHATRADIKAELSEDRARATAAWTRPALTAKDRRHCAVTQVAVPLHADEHHRRLWLPLENPTGIIAPTQSGKSRRDFTPKILAAPGGMLVSTTKPELRHWHCDLAGAGALVTHRRMRRPDAGDAPREGPGRRRRRGPGHRASGK